MTVDNPITYEQAKDELQALRGNLKAELAQFSEKHLTATDTKARRDINLITALVDEFAEASMVRMVKLFMQALHEEKPKSSEEHIDLVIKKAMKQFSTQ
ncbi:hypothetical protein ICN32_00780 [Polynucleobacter wuianus]|uniref:hypothetical protein n=1 Tax=Polynucleobacter wuianus TaxID=1743168 RepID=UPI001C0A974B|nr:hypothetical protein [Polynucleobacter wuianus]MBU3609092.1 hypothetical protein [Polynucleobacter wuianus]